MKKNFGKKKKPEKKPINIRLVKELITAKLGHIEENLAIIHDRELVPSKIESRKKDNEVSIKNTVSDFLLKVKDLILH